jgi:peptidoglycan-associated lipoprotein
MRRSLYMLSVMLFFLAAIAVTGTGCKKKVIPPPPPPPPKAEQPPSTTPSPSPAIRLSASPSSIDKGGSATLTWSSTNANAVNIDNGLGTVEASGSRSVSPTISTTYTARASGPGGNTSAEARVTVTELPPPPTPAAQPISDAEFFETNVKDIYFDYDKYEIRSDAQATLQGDARSLGERSAIRITIEGHCDERGSEKYNLALGDRRANAAKEYLFKLGLNSDRVDTISYGKERPICQEHSEECWQKNRRGHFVLR